MFVYPPPQIPMVMPYPRVNEFGDGAWKEAIKVK